MDSALDSVLARAKAQVGSLMLLDPDTHALRIVAARGFSQEVMDQVKKLTLAPGQGIAGHVYQTGKPYYLRDPQKDPMFVHQNISLNSNFQFLSLPLADQQGRTIGVLNIHFPTEVVLGSYELDQISRLANQLTDRLLDPRHSASKLC